MQYEPYTELRLNVAFLYGILTFHQHLPLIFTYKNALSMFRSFVYLIQPCYIRTVQPDVSATYFMALNPPLIYN